MKKTLLFICVFTVFYGLKTQAQTPQGCDIAAIRAAFQAAGHYTELNVSGQPCSLYFIDESPNDAGTAEGLAGQLGAHLAVMNDATENANVVAAVNAAGYLTGGRKVWLGYKRTGTNASTFYALDGSTGAFTPGPAAPGLFQNWSGGEPNNSGYSGCCTPLVCSYKNCNGEQCVQIYANGLWNDEDCSDNSSKSVIEVNLCPVVTSTQDTTICGGARARLWASAILGSSPYNFSWSPGSLSGSVHNVFPSVPTTYTVSVTDRYGCSAFASTNVSINTNCFPPPQPLGCNITEIRTRFQQAGHYTELDVQGQDCSLYFIDESPNDAATAENLANALGAHLVVMNDAAENANVIAAVNAAGYLSGGRKVWIGIKRTGTAASTFYALDGSTGAFTPGPATPFLYQNWNGGEPNNSGYSNCCSFFCDYKDCNGEQCVQIYSSGFWNDEDCSDGNSKSIIEVNLCPNIRASNDTVLCNPNTVNITTNVIQGSAPYTYAWTPGGQASSSITVTPNTSTTYKVRVTDRYSCYQEDSTVVTVIPINPPVITATSLSVCVGEMDTLNYTGTFTSNADLHWYLDGATFWGNSAILPYVVSWSQPGVHNVSLFVTDDICTSQTTVLPITVNPIPVSDAGIDVTLCSDSSATLGTASTAGYSYVWNPVTGLNSSMVSNPVLTITNSTDSVIVNEYIVTTTSAEGCVSSDTMQASIRPPVSTTFSVSSNLVCGTETVTVTYTGVNDASATYTWNFDGGTVVSGSGQGPYVVNWNTAGVKQISLDVTANGCPGATTVNTVTVGAVPVSNAGADVTLCADSSITLGTASTAGYTYSWTPATGLSSSTVSNPVLTLTNPTSSNISAVYIVTTVGDQGCTSTDTVQATVFPNPVTTFSVNPTTACIGENVTITYTGSNSSSAVYTWNFDGGTVVSGSGQGPYTVNWGASGSPQISLNVTESGCPGIPTVESLTVAAPPTVDAGADIVVCSGGTVQIGSAPTAGYTYQWSPTDKLDNPTSSQPNFSYQNTSTLAETYTYTVVANQDGCTASDNVNVTIDAPALTTVTTDGSTTFCEGGTVTLTSDDPNLISRSWFPNGETSQSITVVTGNQFGLTGYDAQGCYYVSNTVITTQVFSPAVALAPNGLKDESCTDYNDGSITLSPTGGNPPYNYVWDGGQTTGTISNLADGTYAVTVSDQYNCSASAQYTINTAVDFYVNIDSVINATCFGFADGVVLASSTGGQQPYAYVWSNGFAGARNANLPAGTYTVTASDANGCAADSTVTLTEYEEIEATTSADLFINYTEQVQINVTVTPFSSYTYLWSPASTLTCTDCEDPVAFPVRTTTYTLVVRDENTYCLDTTLFKVVVDPSKRLYAPNAFTPNGDSRNDTWRVFAKGVKYFNVQIFNRWGEKVFDSSDIESGWDGTYKGAFVSPGIYVYQFSLTYLDGEMVNQKGSVTVIR